MDQLTKLESERARLAGDVARLRRFRACTDWGGVVIASVVGCFLIAAMIEGQLSLVWLGWSALIVFALIYLFTRSFEFDGQRVSVGGLIFGMLNGSSPGDGDLGRRLDEMRRQIAEYDRRISELSLRRPD